LVHPLGVRGKQVKGEVSYCCALPLPENWGHSDEEIQIFVNILSWHLENWQEEMQA
jgi:hypothetical protein